MIIILKALKFVSIFATLMLPAIGVYKQQVSKALRLPTWQVFIIGSIVVWLFIQIGVYFTNAYLLAELNTFDLDGNDVFSRDELTPAQAKAMRRVISDTGRALAPFTGAIFALIYMSILIMFFGFIRLIKEEIFPSKR